METSINAWSLHAGRYVLLKQGGHVPGQRPRTVLAVCHGVDKNRGEGMALVQIVHPDGTPKYRDKWVSFSAIAHVFPRRISDAMPSRSQIKTARDWLPREEA